MFQCDTCLKSFKSNVALGKHQCVWCCEDCCEMFNFKHVYKRHLNSKKHLKKCKHNENIVLKCDTPGVGNTIVNQTNNNNHTNNITNNITNNTTNNIVIFGNEDFSYISKNDIQEALRTKNVLPRICKLMRRNPNHPENRNIKVTDYSRGKTRIFGKCGWGPAQPIDTFNNMITEASGILDNKTYEANVQYSQPDMERVDEITDKVHELDMAQWQGRDTKWGQENRRAIMLEFVD